MGSHLFHHIVHHYHALLTCLHHGSMITLHHMCHMFLHLLAVLGHQTLTLCRLTGGLRLLH